LFVGRCSSIEHQHERRMTTHDRPGPRTGRRSGIRSSN
jgi:hypothetical protein